MKISSWALNGLKVESNNNKDVPEVRNADEIYDQSRFELSKSHN